MDSVHMTKGMKAWVQSAPGPIERELKLVDNITLPIGPLKEGHILIRVVSASLNHADYKVLEMGLGARAITSFPKTVGMDLSGVVAGVAADVTDVAVGDVVLARLDPTKAPGSLAEHVIVARDGYAKLPPGFDFDQAAGAPTAGLTALQSIKPYVKPGDWIFINGGSGATGTFGIQIAKALGCHVTTSCSTAKITLCQELGADVVIDYKKSDIVSQLKKQGQIYSLVVDNVGSSPPDFFSTAGSFLMRDGHFVAVGGAASASNAYRVARAFLQSSCFGGRNFIAYLSKNNHDDMKQLAIWLGDGTISTIIDSKYEFDAVAEAFLHVKKASTTGKVIVHVSSKD
ncbi:hypothetical protein NQ176_g4464 [Zarea fungicola]|uniref:Uncharacterized protein n=1 Tax=Zarea fungicola TaxID=93591 RepID=A0ACC1NEQ1_9HYPO|nr:hypothetical protein NQ176_g4464 [Lecanicillium fungicola]